MVGGESSMKHILVVDDDPLISVLLREALETEGRYVVSCVERGIDALWELENNRPDLAIIDVRLPDMSGVRLASRALERAIPVLMITGTDGEAGALRESACPLLAKPFGGDGLQPRVLGMTIDDTHLKRYVPRALSEFIDNDMQG